MSRTTVKVVASIGAVVLLAAACAPGTEFGADPNPAGPQPLAEPVVSLTPDQVSGLARAVNGFGFDLFETRNYYYFCLVFLFAAYVLVPLGGIAVFGVLLSPPIGAFIGQRLVLTWASGDRGRAHLYHPPYHFAGGFSRIEWTSVGGPHARVAAPERGPRRSLDH